MFYIMILYFHKIKLIYIININYIYLNYKLYITYLNTYSILYKYKTIIQNIFYKINFQLSNHFIFNSRLTNLNIYFSGTSKGI